MIKLISHNKFIAICIISLMVLSFICLFFDNSLSHSALSFSSQARDETHELGEIFQLARVFGKADVVILLGLMLGLAGKRKLLLKILCSLIVVAVLVHPIKQIVGRERPDASASVSFPSGDTATAFIMPEVFSGNLPMSIASCGVAALAGTSRIFYAQHYPGDVLMGAALGLLAGLAGTWLSKKIHWLPSYKQIAYFTVVFLTVFLLVAALNKHHRHIVQFLAWYGPALWLYIAHNRLKPLYGKRSGTKENHISISGPLYSLLYNSFIFSFILAIALLVVPWLIPAPGLRAPAASAGILLIVYSMLNLRNMRTHRFGAVLTDSASLLYIIQIYTAGYLLNIL